MSSYRSSSVWNQTPDFTLIIQSFSVLVGECIHSRISVLRNNCSDLNVTLTLALFIMRELHSRAFIRYKFPKPYKPQACSLEVLEGSLVFPQFSTEFSSFMVQGAFCHVHGLNIRTQCKSIRKPIEVTKHNLQ